MIGHDQQQIQIPPLARGKCGLCPLAQHYVIVAKLIRGALLTASGDEIYCAEASGEIRLVIQSSAHDAGHPAIISTVAIPSVERLTPTALGH
jgi:hypothetical protein